MSQTNKGGEGSVGTGTTSPTHQITQQLNELRNPTDYMNVFREFVQRAGQIGVTQQQLLDSISDSYRQSK